jgi:type I restriction enzyme S subunit
MRPTLVKLHEIAETSSGGTPSRGVKGFYNGDIPWIKSGELPDGEITIVEEKITQLGLESSSAKLVPEGTLVIAMYGATVGRLGILTFPAATNQAVCAIVPSAALDRDYLFHWLLSIRSNLIETSFGGAQPNISQAVIRDLEVPLYPIKQQRHIAARLKAQLAEVDKARQAAEAQLRDASLLVTRYREKAIEQLEDVPRVPLGELLHGIEAGKSFQTTELIARPDELGVLKVSAVSWNEFLPQEAKADEGEYQPDERHKIKRGDLIISRANTLELVGAVVRVADDFPMRLLSDKTLRLVVNEEMVLPDYLLTILKRPEARSHIENNATGTSDSMGNISQKTINSIPVPVLTFDKQRELIKCFSQFNEEMALVQKSGNAMLNDINLLPLKILAQAFEI